MTELLMNGLKLLVLIISLGGSLITIRKWFRKQSESFERKALVSDIRQDIKVYYLQFCHNHVDHISEYILMDIARVLAQAKKYNVNGVTSFMQESLKKLLEQHLKH